MREIKFRAWHAGAKKMYTVTYLDMEQGEVTEIAVKVHEAEGIVYSSVCPVKNLELMQYTGLHDKNGVEIYEGDLCKIDDGMMYSPGAGMIEGVYEVYWNDDRWGLREHGGNSDYDNGDYYRGDDITWNKATVIGNIYDQK